MQTSTRVFFHDSRLKMEHYIRIRICPDFFLASAKICSMPAGLLLWGGAARLVCHDIFLFRRYDVAHARCMSLTRIYTTGRVEFSRSPYPDAFYDQLVIKSSVMPVNTSSSSV